MKTNFINKISKNFNDNKLSTEMKLKNFPRFVERRDVQQCQLLVPHEIRRRDVDRATDHTTGPKREGRASPGCRKS